MTHSTAVLFSHFGAWLLGLSNDKPREDGPVSPMPVQPQARHNRLPPRDESFYWAWQYWSQ